MSQITIQNLHFTYEGDHTPVFEGLDLQLDTNWKLGLVGRNGRGKTTLLRLLAGELEGRGNVALSQPCLRWTRPVNNPGRRAMDILLEGVPPRGGVAAELGAVQAGAGGGTAGPPLLHPQRRGADPGPAGRPLSGRGGLPHD